MTFCPAHAGSFAVSAPNLQILVTGMNFFPAQPYPLTVSTFTIGRRPEDVTFCPTQTCSLAISTPNFHLLVAEMTFGPAQT